MFIGDSMITRRFGGDFGCLSALKVQARHSRRLIHYGGAVDGRLPGVLVSFQEAAARLASHRPLERMIVGSPSLAVMGLIHPATIHRFAWPTDHPWYGIHFCLTQAR